MGISSKLWRIETFSLLLTPYSLLLTPYASRSPENARQFLRWQTQGDASPVGARHRQALLHPVFDQPLALRRIQRATGPHRPVTGQGRQHRPDACFKRRRRVPLGEVFDEILYKGGVIELPQQRRDGPDHE